MATVTSDQIKAALRKLGPSSPGTLADELGVEQLPAHLLKHMLDQGEIKAAGTSRARRLALPDQKLDTPAAPPAQRKNERAPRRRRPRASAPGAPPHRSRYLRRAAISSPPSPPIAAWW